MVQTNAIKTKWVQRSVIAYVLLMIVGLIWSHTSAAPAHLFDLRFNGYALISAAALVVNLTFLAIVLTRQSEFKSTEAAWFVVFLGAIIMFSASEMFQRLSPHPSAALFWAQLAGIGPAFEPIGLFLFTLYYVNRRDINIAFMTLVLLGGGILFFFHGNGGLIFQTASESIKSYPWGFNNDIGKAFVFNALWALGLVTLALTMLLRFRRRTQNRILKKQSGLFALAFSFPLVGALIFDILGPSFGLSVPPLHDVFTVGTAGLMLYGLRHYRLFEVTPASIASDILSTMSESVVVTDPKLKIELMNQAAETTFGQTFEHVGGQSLLHLFGPDEARRIEGAIKEVAGSNEKQVIGNYVIKRDERTTYISVTVVKITEDHGISGYVLAAADTSELQRSYMALEQAKADVDNQVELRTKELRQAQERLAETDKIKTEFVILASHNLRTPLTSLKGNLEFLTETKLNKKQQKFLEAIQEGTQRLYDLIEELLTISRIETGDKLVMQKVSLKQVLEPLIGEALTLADNTKNVFTYKLPEEPVTLNVNPTRLQTAIHNLLDNAFKFTKLGYVQLIASVDQNQVKIKVIDTGIGIVADEVPKLFTQFHRGTSRDGVMTYDYAGKGIGLYLAKLIVEEHQGHIEVDSQPNHGSTFTVVLPIN